MGGPRVEPLVSVLLLHLLEVKVLRVGLWVYSVTVENLIPVEVCVSSSVDADDKFVPALAVSVSHL